MPAEPKLYHIMLTESETVHAMSTMPVSSNKMVTTPESALEDTTLIVTMAILLLVTEKSNSITEEFRCKSL